MGSSLSIPSNFRCCNSIAIYIQTSKITKHYPIVHQTQHWSTTHVNLILILNFYLNSFLFCNYSRLGWLPQTEHFAITGAGLFYRLGALCPINQLAAYPAEGRPGSLTTGQWTTKLDSGTQKHLIRSPIEGYGPRAQATTRAGQRAWPLPKSDHRPACRPARVARGVSQYRQFCTNFRNFTHYRPKSSGCFSSVHIYIWPLWPLWTVKSFMEIGLHVFQKTGRHTHRQTWQIYIYINRQCQTKKAIRLL